MNNKGQTLILFVILLPLFIMMGAYMIDSGYILIEKNKLDDIRDIAVDAYEDGLQEEEIKELIIRNDDDINIIKCDINNGIIISLQKHIDSIFGKLVGYEDYEINSSVTIKN